ncbi:hypothetical protein [Roseovarius mucosus]|nr:hypothetical protein [Roseovarius mucosus]
MATALMLPQEAYIEADLAVHLSGAAWINGLRAPHGGVRLRSSDFIVQ